MLEGFGRYFCDAVVGEDEALENSFSSRSQCAEGGEVGDGVVVGDECFERPHADVCMCVCVCVCVCMYVCMYVHMRETSERELGMSKKLKLTRMVTLIRV